MKSGINGLVLAGGESRRMGASKGELDYWGKEQQYHAYDMLSGFCDKVFISCRQSQAWLILPEYQVLTDNKELGEIGPMNALITAFEYENTAWLVLGCDYPLFGTEETQNLLNKRDEYGIATAVLNQFEKKPEPLMALYETKAFEVLLQEFHKGNESLRKILIDNNCNTVPPLDTASIESVDTLEKFLEVKKHIHSRR